MPTFRIVDDSQDRGYLDECYLVDTVQARLVFGLNIHGSLLAWSFREYVRVRLVIVGNERLASARYHEPPEAFQRTCCLQLGHGSKRHQTLRRLETRQTSLLTILLNQVGQVHLFYYLEVNPSRPPDRHLSK